jgi:hypothetical protein
MLLSHVIDNPCPLVALLPPLRRVSNDPPLSFHSEILGRIAMFFFDWLEGYQDYDFDLPIVSPTGYCHIDFLADPGEQYKSPRQSRFSHEGSYSTSIQIHVNGRRIHISGNPSRYNRIDNLFGLETLAQCVSVYNGILESLGLPKLSPCTWVGNIERTTESGAIKLEQVANGFVITRTHITKNMAVGAGNCVDAYLKALSSQPYRNSRGRLHADGKTVDWLSKQGNARFLYPSVYDKAHEIALHSLARVKRKFGEDSPEYQYLLSVQQYCEQAGVARFELKLNSPFIKKHKLQYYGLSDYSILTQIFNQFLNVDEKLKVSAMEYETVSETLLRLGIVDNTRAANLTATYHNNWMHGQKFDLNKSQVQIHRARLRKIGIDIARPFNILTFSPVIIKEVIEIEKRELPPPPNYKFPNHLRLVA